MIEVRIVDDFKGTREEWLRRRKLMGKAAKIGALEGTRGLAYRAIRTTLNSRPNYLGRVKGWRGGLVASVDASVIVRPYGLTDGLGFLGTFGNDTDYGYKHEYGGVFEESVREHSRRTRTGGIATVRAHQRTRTYRERRMFRDAWSRFRQEAMEPFEKSVAEASKGVEPTPQGVRMPHVNPLRRG